MSVGAQLAAARVARGWSVDDLSAATSVRAAVVAAIERDDFGPSGGPAYARGHIRLLAKELGLDQGALMVAFDEQVGGPEASAIAASLVRHNAAERELLRGTPVRWGRAIALVLVVVVGVVAAYAGYRLVRG